MTAQVILNYNRGIRTITVHHPVTFKILGSYTREIYNWIHREFPLSDYQRECIEKLFSMKQEGWGR
jgi:hypothetical protein